MSKNDGAEINPNYNGFIYVTTNLVNGRWYIGSCWCKNMDRTGYLGSGTLLLRAIKKYGRKNFRREIIFHYYDDDPFGLKDIETAFLQDVDAAGDSQSYNLKNYGYGLPWGENSNAPVEVRKKWSENSYWRNHPPPHMDRLQKGRETFAKSEAGKEFFQKNGIHLERFRQSPEWKVCVARFAEWSKQPKSEEHKRNISIALTGHQKTEEHRKNHSASLRAGGKVAGPNNPRARECARLDTLETFGSVNDLVENINADQSLDMPATLGGVWDALNRNENGGFYKGKVWVYFTADRKSIAFSTQTDQGRQRRRKIGGLIKSGLSNKEIREKTGASEKLIRSVRRQSPKD
jgi:hypothetical protein